MYHVIIFITLHVTVMPVQTKMPTNHIYFKCNITVCEIVSCFLMLTKICKGKAFSRFNSVHTRSAYLTGLY